ncbi:hypothetical protein [Aquibacillus saliphilus]|uniref:hypothetical protein n=1 Tax=Aquibacillus saliphilus TaxID=1909422 RepID=UPI001CF00791|nr:hypothetical protein [Aquibacillus saliphilus]
MELKELTTVQMIEELQEGYIGECINAPIECVNTVEISRYGNIQFTDGCDFILTEFIRNRASWIIKSKPVSFEKVREAAKKGKLVQYKLRGKVGQFSYNSRLHNFDQGAFSFEMLDNAEWTILD